MKAVIFGITGQDGSWLSEFLLEQGYQVIGVHRRSSVNTTQRLGSVLNNSAFILQEGDVTDPSSINHVMADYQPDECYNFAAQSHVHTSFEQPVYTFQVNAVGVLNILEAIRQFAPNCRFVQASTSEMFGSAYTIGYNGDEAMSQTPQPKYQDEATPFSPNSPYAVSKVAAHHLVCNYREAYNLHASCAIMFNHESERRGENFVTRKITQYVARLQKFLDCAEKNDEAFPKLHLGNLDARRDWGYALDYVQACHLMLQQDVPDDYVISTQEHHSVREFLDEAFACIGIHDWHYYVEQDFKFFRPVDVEFLHGNSGKIRNKLNWEPTVTFKELVQIMVRSDIDELRS